MNENNLYWKYKFEHDKFQQGKDNKIINNGKYAEISRSFSMTYRDLHEFPFITDKE